MKKIFILLIIFLFTIYDSYAIENYINWKERILINKMSSKIKKNIDDKGPEYKKNIENKITELQKNNEYNDRNLNILENIKKNINIKESDIEYIEYYKKYNIDFQVIKDKWLQWHNYERDKLWKSLYTYDDKLIKTAYEWSHIQKDKWYSTHKRNIGDSYYNYPKIEKWFNDRWVKCEIIWWMTITESIWRQSYKCSENDCTDKLIWWLQKVFNMYMKEKWLKYPNNAHYRSIINNDLSKIWFGISIKQNKNHYDFYLTTHYCTKFK